MPLDFSASGSPVPEANAPDNDVESHFEGAGKVYGIDPDLLRAMGHVESGYGRNMVSPAGAQGFMQIMPETQAALGVTDPFSNRQSIYGGAKYLRQQLDNPKFTPADAIMAYNAGPGRVSNPPDETLKYLNDVTEKYRALRAAKAKPDFSGSGTLVQGPLVIGDSLAVGIQRQLGADGVASEGKDPAWVQGQIDSLDPARVRGRNVVLSGGASNNPDQVGFVENQIRSLQKMGAGSVTVVGVGDRQDIAGANATLADIAKRTGAQFQPVDPGNLSDDRVHPRSYQELAAAVGAPPKPDFSHFGTPVEPEGRPLTSKQAVKQLPMAKTEAEAPLPPTQHPTTTEPPQQPEQPMTGGLLPGGLGRVGEAMRQAYQPEFFTPEGKQRVESYGWVGKNIIEPAGEAVGTAMASVNAAFAGFLTSIYEKVKGETGDEVLARDVAARYENLGMEGAPHVPLGDVLSAAREGRPTPGPMLLQGQPEVAARPAETPPASVQPAVRPPTAEQAALAELDPETHEAAKEAHETLRAAAKAEGIDIPKMPTLTQMAREAQQRAAAEARPQPGEGGIPTIEVRPRPEVPTGSEAPPAQPTREETPPPVAEEAPGAQAPRIRTVEQIREQDGVNAKRAQEIQNEEIASVGRPVTPDEVAARRAGIEAAPPPEPPVERPDSRQPEPAWESTETGQNPVPTEHPFVPVPKAPQRLNDFLRSLTVQFPGAIHETTIPGGIKDVGGDLKAIIGGAKGRPGLINNKTGRDWDNAAEHAWEAGYFPGHTEPPTINELQDAIRDDHTGIPRYSEHDADAVQAFHYALEHNAEIDRLGAEYGIPTTGMNHAAFYDQLHDMMSVDDRAREIASQDAAGREAEREFEAQAKTWTQEQEEAWHAGRFYGASQTRTLGDLEREYQQENATTAAGEHAGRVAETGPPGAVAGVGEEGAGPHEPGVGPPGRTEAEVPATDLLGTPLTPPGDYTPEAIAARRARNDLYHRALSGDEAASEELERLRAAEGYWFSQEQPEATPKRGPEPTIRNDPRQIGIEGTEPSAVQVQAARDAGRGTLRGKVPQQEPSGMFDYVPGQGTLYAGPGAIFDPAAWRRAFGPLAPYVRAVRDKAGAVTKSVADGLAPMQGGTVRSQAFAANFVNALRQVQFRYGSLDREIVKNFTPAERRQMGQALDAQSVFEQQVRDLPADQQAAARQAFDDGKTGLAGLTAKQRQPIEALNLLSTDQWQRYQELGMVAPNARGIPYYFPRQILLWSEENGYTRTGGQGGNRGLDQRGANLTTQGPMRREHLTPEETEAAAKAVLGPTATLLQDIRSLPSRLAYGQRAIAGKELLNAIDEVGKATGVNTVVRGDIPGILNPGDYFTMADHPAFREWTGTGWRAIHVAREFEGQLKAILTKPSPVWYRAAQGIKAAQMYSIMWSPFQHLQVEIGRALPMLLMHDPVGTLTLKFMRDGNRVRQDLNYMDAATRDGIAPLAMGGGWATDPVTIADQANVAGRSGFLAAVRDLHENMARGVGNVLGERAADIARAPHQALLWDQVFNLQMGMYDLLKNKWSTEYSPEVAGMMAAHVANRYAGALPPEHLSRGANMAANLLLFSRSFTLGNLAVIKDMFTGAPQHVLARIEQMAGPEVRASAKRALQRKAIAAFTMDIGLYVLAGNLAQSAFQAINTSVQSTYDDWVEKAKTALADASSNPLELFGVLPQYWNEPGKQGRILTGQDPQGTASYARAPIGKVGEEFLGWFTHPGDMLMAKLSPLVRPIVELAVGYNSLGQRELPPNPRTIGDYLETVGDAVKHIAAAQLPMSTIQGMGELYQHYVEGKKGTASPIVSWTKLLGPATGLFQMSQGYPGGPAAGEIHAASERQQYELRKAMPAIRDKIKAGDLQGAVKDMTALGVAPGLQRYYLQQTEAPGPTHGQLQKFLQYATPEQRQRAGLPPQ